MAIAFQVNGERVSTESAPDTRLIWILQEHLKLTGTKISCGLGVCGACTDSGAPSMEAASFSRKTRRRR